ncbi:hypothetical protein CCP3SC1AL1_1210006 [Gammaproteobacteria bacterium]|jgi:hypothetical protein
MAIIIDPNIASSGLLMSIDAANTRSYAGSGLTVTGLVQSLNGTLINGVGFTSSNSGAFSFDGSNDHLTATLDLRRDFTLSCWVYQNNLNFAYFGLGDPANNAALHIFNSSDGYLRFGMYYNDLQTDGVSFSINTWYNYVFTYLHSSPYTKKIYRNGQQLNAVNSGQAQFTGTGTFRIGALWSTSASSHYANGLISQVQVYGRVLTDSEIKNNFEATRDRYGI